ncbi:MAG: hypothetical protein ACI9KE_001253 [Polyangiales bacterium]|jgi:hypothetical protein
MVKNIIMVFALALLSSCTPDLIDTSEEAAAEVRDQDLGTFPYHPVVFNLDLATYTYQLFSQTIAWPFDPYYEDLGEGRDGFIERVKTWSEVTGQAQAMSDLGIAAYRGPGILSGFENNDDHDPIIYQYSRLHPWSDTLTYPLERWTEYLTPSQITGSVEQAWMCTRTRASTSEDHEAGVAGTVELHELTSRRADADADARDILLAFEGATGDKGEEGQPSSQSLMGFALLRFTGEETYDLHIAFRGSRSGSAGRAARDAFSTGDARGNPDWITDLGYRAEVQPHISTGVGHEVSRGMAQSIAETLPQLFYCLDQVSLGSAPTNIYVTGHSLGGALAQHFASAVLLGDRFSAGNPGLPAALEAWPWQNLKLITFSAPRVGNEAWALALTERLESNFYEDRAIPYDDEAIGVLDPEILPRLNDPSRPAIFRVLLPSDPVTTDLIAGGSHVGQTVYLENPNPISIASHSDFEAHEPIVVRQRITDVLRDTRVPERAWAYQATADLTPLRDDSMAGSASEYTKLIDSVSAYYEDRGLYFDHDAFDAGVGIFLGFIE